MDFSPETLIDFGLNLAGYAIVTLLVFLISNRRSSKKKAPSKEPENKMTTTPVARNKSAAAGTARMDFIAFADEKGGRSDEVLSMPASSDQSSETVPTSRQENRRAIYREARRLLARGKSGRDLMDSLPITEDEVEMLSFSRQA